MVSIPGLPPELSTVPPAPTGPDDPDADRKRGDWLAWRLAVHTYRAERHMLLGANPDLIPFERALCAASRDYWSLMWLRIFEPRNRKSGTGFMPYIPFASQVEVGNKLLWSLKQEDQHADVIWSKSRGWGASWEGCKTALWGWTFSHLWGEHPAFIQHPETGEMTPWLTTAMPWNVLMLSRKEELVDSKLQRSLFWKIRRLMRDMPDWQMPVGWNPDQHDQKNAIVNPANGNELAGESTNTKAGRGDRVSWAWLDELAAMPNALSIWGTIAETTDHRVGVSTENNDEGTDFYELGIGRESGDDRPYLIETDWFQNPMNDQEWFERQKARYGLDMDAFNREILRDPFAGSSTWVYPWARTKEPEADVMAVSGWPSFVSIDPGFRDPTALLAIQESPHGEVHVVDAYALEGKEAEFFVPLLKPSLFADTDPHWAEKSYLTWTTKTVDADGQPTTFEYQEREIAFARTVAVLGKPTYVGDTYGNIVTGVINDSVYLRWNRYGIHVHRDRTDEPTPAKKRTRQFPGRREAMNDRANRFRFGATDGARVCLKALKDNKYKPRTDRLQQTEPKEPLHDWTSHYVTALEFFAVHIRARSLTLSRELSKPNKSRLGGQITNMGAKRASLRPLPALQGAAD